MESLVHTRVSTAALVVAAMAFVGSSRATGGESRPSTGRPPLDLHLRTRPGADRIEGEWLYRPFDGSGPYLLVIRSTQGGFYELEGRREGVDRPVLQFDRASDGAGYRGEILEGFDPCIPAGARYTLTVTEAGLWFEPSLPVVRAVVRKRATACDESMRYVVSASGRDQQVRLKPPDDIPGLGGSRIPGTQDPSGDRASTGSEPRPANAAAEAPTITLGAPSVEDGSPVTVLGSVRDGNDRLWHHVRLLTPVDEDASLAAPERSKEGAGAEQEADEEEGLAARRGASAGEDAGRPERDPSPSPPPPKTSPAASASARPKGPASGYIPAENLVVRWECRLERLPPGGEGGGAKADPGR